MSEYGKIDTLYERDPDTFKVKPGEFKNRTYSLLKSWVWTEKVDGTNVRCIWDSSPGSKLSFGGRSNNAQLHKDLINYLTSTITVEKLWPIFPVSDVVIYGEGYGAGIQKGGGDYRSDKGFIIFDILVNGVWLSYENVKDIADKLNVPIVPLIGEMSLEDATEFVKAGFRSRCSINPNKEAEGLVGRPAECLYDKRFRRLITKLKTKDF